MKIIIEIESIQIVQMAGACSSVCHFHPDTEITLVFEDIYRQIMKHLPKDEAKAMHKEIFEAVHDKEILKEGLDEAYDRIVNMK